MIQISHIHLMLRCLAPGKKREFNYDVSDKSRDGPKPQNGRLRPFVNVMANFARTDEGVRSTGTLVGNVNYATAA